jgi:Flp pilus assembly protein TadG
MAALEFAIIAPVLITLFFGMSEISDALTASTKVTAVASTAADLVAQDKSICTAEMNDIFAALNAIMFPYDAKNMKIVVSSLIDAGSNKVKVAWSKAQNTTARATNTVVPIPSGLVDSGGGGSVILAEVTYNYYSATGKLIYGTFPLSDTFYLRPRRTAQIAFTTSC